MMWKDAHQGRQIRQFLLSEGRKEENGRQVTEDSKQEAATETPEHRVGEERLVEPNDRLPL